MIRVVAHHILSPLGDSTAANLQAVRNGASSHPSVERPLAVATAIHGITFQRVADGAMALWGKPYTV